MLLNSKSFKPRKRKMLESLKKLSMTLLTNTTRMLQPSWNNTEHSWKVRSHKPNN